MYPSPDSAEQRGILKYDAPGAQYLAVPAAIFCKIPPIPNGTQFDCPNSTKLFLGPYLVCLEWLTRSSVKKIGENITDDR